MHPFNQNNSFIQITPRARLNFYRTKHNTYEAQNLTAGLHMDELATMNCS